MPPRVRRLAVLLVASAWFATPVSAAVCGLTCAPHAGMTMAAHRGMAAADAAPPIQAAHDHHHHDASTPVPPALAAPSAGAGSAPCAAWGVDHACCAADAGSGAPTQAALRGPGPDPRPVEMAAGPAAAALAPAGRSPAAARPIDSARCLARRTCVLRI